MPVIREKFPARVTNNDDPEQRGRIKVTCPGLMGDDETELPGFIEPAFHWGMFQVPDIGELVEIECIAKNDQEEDASYQAFLENPNLCWSGTRFDSLKSGAQRPPNPLFNSKNYGKRRGFHTPVGHILFFDDTDGDRQVSMVWREGEDTTQVTMDKEGSILLLTKNGQMVHLNAKSGNEGITILDKHTNMIATGKDGVVVNDLFGNFVDLKDGVIAVSATGDVQVQASNGVNIQSGVGEVDVSMSADGQLDINASGDVNITCVNAKIDADTYELGKGADSPLVRWNELQPWLDGHTHPTALGPSGPGSAGATGPFAVTGADSTIGTLKCSIWSVLFTLAMIFWFMG